MIDQTLITNGLSVTEPNPSLLSNNHPLLQHRPPVCVCVCACVRACKMVCPAWVWIHMLLTDVFCKLQSLCCTVGQIGLVHCKVHICQAFCIYFKWICFSTSGVCIDTVIKTVILKSLCQTDCMLKGGVRQSLLVFSDSELKCTLCLRSCYTSSYLGKQLHTGLSYSMVSYWMTKYERLVWARISSGSFQSNCFSLVHC